MKATVITSQSMTKNIKLRQNIKHQTRNNHIWHRHWKTKNEENRETDENSDHWLSNSSRDNYKSPTSQTTHDL